ILFILDLSNFKNQMFSRMMKLFSLGSVFIDAYFSLSLNSHSSYKTHLPQRGLFALQTLRPNRINKTCSAYLSPAGRTRCIASKVFSGERVLTSPSLLQRRCMCVSTGNTSLPRAKARTQETVFVP